MARLLTLGIVTLFISLIFVTASSAQQSRSYEIIPAPDLWYNSVDGIRVGIRLKGQVPGTFEDGPHRLDAGLWLSTWFPDLPVSYYISYTEPIQSWSDFGSEASIQAISSIRTGYSRHGIAFNKRWQKGFDERKFYEFRIFNSYEKRFDTEYTAFPALWSEKDKLLTNITAGMQDKNALGRYTLSISGTLQFNQSRYGFASLTAVQNIPFSDSWGLRLRGFAGASTDETAPEYLFARNTGQAIQTLQSGVTRAMGTIPQPWMESGNFHIAGGANLRGYTSADIEQFMAGLMAEDDSYQSFNLFRSMGAVNTELDYYNPVATLFNRIPYASDFINFRSYLFFDAGSPLGVGDDPASIIADAGAGFALSLNIPDYLGKPRGFVLRYEIPFWLSDPVSGKNFQFRSLAGFGAVVSF